MKLVKLFLILTPMIVYQKTNLNCSFAPNFTNSPIIFFYQSSITNILSLSLSLSLYYTVSASCPCLKLHKPIHLNHCHCQLNFTHHNNLRFAQLHPLAEAKASPETSKSPHLNFSLKPTNSYHSQFVPTTNKQPSLAI